MSDAGRSETVSNAHSLDYFGQSPKVNLRQSVNPELQKLQARKEVYDKLQRCNLILEGNSKDFSKQIQSLNASDDQYEKFRGYSNSAKFIINKGHKTRTGSKGSLFSKVRKSTDRSNQKSIRKKSALHMSEIS